MCYFWNRYIFLFTVCTDAKSHTTDHFEKEKIKKQKFWQLIGVQKEEGDHELDYDTFSETKMLACATFGMTWATCHFSSRT